MSHLRRTLALIAATLFGIVAAAGGAQAQLAQNTQPAEGDGRLVLVLDSSGSMAEPDASGTSKIEAARSALHTVVDDLPADATVGMRVFGATVFSRDDAGACEDSQLVVPVGPADKPALSAAVDDYEPYGETPIAHALQQAAGDLGSEGPRTILLVSDGEATCEPDPCVVAEQLAAEGIELKIDVVGLNVDDAARAQLSCIADKGNGTYYDAADADDLVASLDTVATRALQPFEVTGTPIAGTPQYDGAPTMETGGQYVDTVPAVDATKYYTIKRSSPGSNIIVGVSGRPDETEIYGQLDVQLMTADGEDCMHSYPTATDGTAYSLLAASVSTLSWFTPELDGPCATADELQLAITQNDGDDIVDTPVQFKLWEYGAVENYDALPAESNFDELSWVEITTQRDSAAAITGAPSFEAAPALTPGTTYSDSVVPGETRIFKVPVEWGQRLQAQVDVDPLSSALADAIDSTAFVGVRLFSPAGANASRTDFGETSNQAPLGSDGATASAATVDVRYRNHECIHDFIAAAGTAGDYYVAVSASPNPGGQSVEIPFALTTSVEGEAGTGEPEFSDVKLPTVLPQDDPSDQPDDEATDQPETDGDDTAGETTEPAANASDDSSSMSATTVALGAGGLVLLALGGFGVYRWARSRS